MLLTALEYNGPAAIRFPRSAVTGADIAAPPHALPIGKGEQLRQGRDVALLAIGHMVLPAMQAAEELGRRGIDCTVINARFIKPLDTELIKHAVTGRFVVTLEEGILQGGFGSAVLEFLQESDAEFEDILCVGLPDKLITHGAQKILRARYRLDAPGIVESVEEFLEANGWPRKDSTASLLHGAWWKHAKKPKP